MIEGVIVGIPILVLWAILVRLLMISIVEEAIEKHEKESRK